MLMGYCYTCSFASDGGDALAQCPTARPSVTATAREIVETIGTLGEPPTAARALTPEPSPFR
jgi:hypothetical protein